MATEGLTTHSSREKAPLRLTRRCVRAVLAFACLAVALPGAALAQDAYEPNEGIHQAAGGLVPGTNYNASIDSNSDRDWFIVHVSGQGALTVSLLNTSDPDACSASITLRNSDGTALNSTSAFNAATEEIVYTTPGAGHYFVQATAGCPVNRYRLTVSGPVVAGPRPASPEPTQNTNRNAATAIGPLSSKLWGGSIDAFSEQDWFFFYTSRTGTFDIALTNVDDADRCSISMTLMNSDERTLNSNSASPDTIAHIQYASPGAAKYLLRISGGCPVNKYQFQITPASILTSTPPPPPPDRDRDGVPDASDECPDVSGQGRADGCPLTTTAPPTPTTPTTPAVSERCTKARTAVTKWTKRLARANKALKSARKALKRRGLTRRKRTSLKRKVTAAKSNVNKAKRSLRSARSQVTRHCT
jgi:hypothetical protein